MNAASAEAPQLDAPLKGNVLLVEDDELTAKWLVDGLKKQGVHCQWAAQAEEAKKAFHHQMHHAVVVDVYLSAAQTPDGLELINLFIESGIPVIVITSKADLQIAKEAINRGASYLLEKPFELKTLQETLRNLWEEPRGLTAMMERFLSLYELTSKEKEVARLLLKGLSNKEIASVTNTSERTVKCHITTIFEKCGLQSRSELFHAIFPT